AGETEPDGALRVGGDAPRRGNRRLDEHVADSVVLDANELPGLPADLGPDAAVGALGQPRDQSAHRSTVRHVNALEAAAIQDLKRGVDSDPQPARSVFEQRRGLLARQAFPAADGGHDAVAERFEHPGFADPDGSVPRREDPIDLVVAQTLAPREPY